MSKGRRRVALLTLIVVIQAGCSSDHTPAPTRVVVTAAGRIGPLHVDTSDRADVIAFAGRPDAERSGRYADFPGFDALGYGCGAGPATGADGVPRCETVFYLDSRSRKLALMYTEDARFADVRGDRVGTPTAVVERRLLRRAFVGCFDGFRLERRTGFLVLWLQGGKDVTSRGHVHLVGGHVAFLVVHSRRRNPGVLDCIDS